MESVLNVEVSCFANYNSPNSPEPVNLLMWLTSAKHCGKVEAIQASGIKEDRDKMKAGLPAITPSGLFTRRNNGALVKHSRLICLDIDPKGNEKINNYNALKHEISNIINVAYCGLSVSGTGFFVLIPITQPERHREHFNALRELFQAKYKVRVDDTPDVARLRGYSYDPNPYFNHNARPFGGIPAPPRPKPQTTRSYTQTGVNGQDERTLLYYLLHRVESADSGNRHKILYAESRLAGGYIAAGRMDEQTAVYALESVVGQWPTFSKSQKTIRDGIRDGLLFPLHPDNSTISKPIQPSREHKPIIPPTRIVNNVADWKPGTILRPDESQLERL